MDNMAEPVFRVKVIQTACSCLCNIGIGIYTAQTGPSLLDLQLLTNTNTRQSSFFFTGKGVGRMIGSLAMGAVFGRWNTMMLMTFACFGLGVTVMITPLTSSFILMIFIHFIGGLFSGALHTGSNADIISIWDKNRRVALQLIHLCFALGGTLAPLIVQPFLANTTSTNDYSKLPSCHLMNNSVVPVVDKLSSDIRIEKSQSVNLHTPVTFIKYAFFINGGVPLLCSVFFLIRYCCFQHLDDNQDSQAQTYNSFNEPLPKFRFIIIMSLLLLIIYLITAVSNSLPAFLLTYLVYRLQWTKVSAARLTSLYWFCYTGGRLCIIFVTNLFSPMSVILVLGMLALLSVIGMLLSSMYNYTVGVWICVAIVGLCLAPQFPTAIAWVHESIMIITPGIMSAIILAASTYDILNSPLIGFLIQTVSCDWFLYLLTIESSAFLLLILVIRQVTNASN